MEECLALLTGALAHSCRGGTERIFVEETTLGTQLFRQRIDDAS